MDPSYHRKTSATRLTENGNDKSTIQVQNAFDLIEVRSGTKVGNP